jgi:GNAT superfamily N-acetyltransferase
VTDIRRCEPGRDIKPFAEQIWDLLVEVDHEFVPPLSGREGTTDRDLGDDRANPGMGRPHSYFAVVLAQHAIVATEAGRLVGLMSMILHRRLPELEHLSPCTYISTVAVTAPMRGRGVGRALYEAVLAIPDTWSSPFLVTRTWSTNGTHLPLLAAAGFGEALRIADDRGPGVDTVYYSRPTPAWVRR